jgi:hypothetical protein
MKLIVSTQYLENYGAHDWDGEGTCPQRWKAKGGTDYVVQKVSEADAAVVLKAVTQLVSVDSMSMREYVIGSRLVADDHLTDWERDQLQFDGQITDRAPAIVFEDGVARHA